MAIDTSFDFIGYMKTAAEKSKDIQHSDEHPSFHRITNLSSLEELLSKANKVDIGYQLIVEDVMKGNFIENEGTLIDIPTYRYYIAKHVKTDDFDAKEETKRACKIVAKKFIARLRDNQYSDLAFTTTNGLKHLDRNSFQYFSIGPLLDGFWGIEVSFSLQEGAHVAYDANDWDE